MENKIISIQEEVKKAIVGKDEIIRRVMAVIIAGGHILLEDIPGVGKTTLALAFSKAMDLKFNRIQFTPDVVPSDITGFTVYNRQTGAFEYKEGAAMCNVLLADEINRTSSKTQSALLEAIQLGRACRNAANLKVRQPLSRMYVKGAAFDEAYQALCEDELNVKEVVFTEDARAFTTYQLKPQMRTLGPKYGKLLGKIGQHLAGMDGNDVVDAFVCARDVRDKYLTASLLWDMGLTEEYAAFVREINE